MLELQFDGDLVVHHAAGGDKAVGSPVAVEERAGMGFDPMVRAVLGQNAVAAENGLSGVDAGYALGAARVVGGFDEILEFFSDTIVDRPPEGGQDRWRDPDDAPMTDAGHDVG